MCRLFSRERDMLPKWHGQMMVRWFSKERDKLHWWSDTGQIDFLCRETHSERWSDNGQMVFQGKRQVALVVSYWSDRFPV